MEEVREELNKAHLGEKSSYPDHYSPELLFRIDRQIQRERLGYLLSPTGTPWLGADVWNSYELSWLDPKGKPTSAVGNWSLPAHSPYLIESKSIKLYLCSLHQMHMGSWEEAARLIGSDLSRAAGVPVDATIRNTGEVESEAKRTTSWQAISLDDLPIDITPRSRIDPSTLSSQLPIVEERLSTHLFKSNCPCTGQPDWASVQILYRGKKIEREGLLRYLVSFRHHRGFHEECVERIFVDLFTRCAPEELAVYMRYTRRGGLDINPYRTTAGYQFSHHFSNDKLWRQ